MTTARRGPWFVAAFALAIAIALLLARRLTREPAIGDAVPGTPALPAASAAVARDDGLRRTETGATAGRESANAPPVERAAMAADDLGTLLHGTVRQASGPVTSVVSVELRVGDQPDLLLRHAWKSTVVQYAFPGLAAGDYRLSVRAEGYREVERAIAIPPGLPSLRVDVDLQPSWLVKVELRTPDGRSLREALAAEKGLPSPRFDDLVNVIASWRELPARLPDTQWAPAEMSVGAWRANGQQSGHDRLDLPARYDGALEMRERRDAFVGAAFRQVVLAQQAIAAAQDEVTLTIDPQRLRASAAAVRLQVVDGATGSPVSGARIQFSESGTVLTSVAGETDGDGRFERATLRPGRHLLSISADGGRSQAYTVDLAPGRTTDLGVFAMSARVQLRIVVPEVAGAAWRRCYLLPIDGSSPGRIAAGHRLDGPRLPLPGGEPSDDLLRANVPPGRYLLHVENGDHGALLEIDTLRVGADPIVVTLAPAPLLRIDASALGEPVGIEVRTADGKSVHETWFDATSAFELRLPAGDYLVRTQRIDGDRREERVALRLGGTTLVVR